MLNLILFFHLLLWFATGVIYLKLDGWPFELFTHWIVTWLVLANVVMVVAGLKKRQKLFLSSVALVALLFVKLVTGYSYQTAFADSTRSDAITLAQWNVFEGNDYVFDWIKTLQDVDVIVLNEVKPWVRDRIADTKLPGYPYTLLPEGLAPDTVILSRLPLESTTISSIEGSPRFILKAEIKKSGQRFALLAMHATSPRSPERYTRRNLELKALAEKVREQTLPTVVAGDLNITPYSPDFVAFIEESQLLLTKQAIFLPVTWPAIPVPGLSISIDHTLVSEDIELLSRAAQYGVCCSDHAPVVTRFAPTIN